ncbi:MAG: DUF4258 domain-containing protein [Acidobacteria bacterium]|nr:DUF4258 domain-containing protein [Acidobacteriota bacterium]
MDAVHVIGGWIVGSQERGLQRSRRSPNVLEVLRSGEVIAEYPEDKPFPSCLLLGFTGGRGLHVVAPMDRGTEACHIITACPPDPARWREDFKTRQTP